jgi:hypothetical protein
LPYAALLVWTLGLAHALAVAAIAFRVLEPLLPETISQARVATRASTLWFAGAAALALGVFLQILWDERPVTAPLSHLRWTDRN